jgi:hypothetical protein
VAEPSRHLQWAKNNEELAESFNLDDSFEVDWAIVILFYSAVHYVDAYLSSRTRRQPDHAGREQEIQSDVLLSTMWREYRELKRMSRDARYELAPFTELHFRKARILLGKIKDEILPRLRPYV